MEWNGWPACTGIRNPKPVRFDGVPPVREREERRLAGLEGLVGIISRAAVGYTSMPKMYYYLNDHLGTPQLMVDSTGTVVWEAKYKPFGETQVQSSSTVVNRFRFPGQYYDQETGLHYNYHRDYHSRIGRYVEPDPIGLNGGVNFYSYVTNNPMNYTDTLGRYAEVGVRPFYPYKLPYARHCFVRFNGNNSDTLSYDDKGVHKDPNPGGATYDKIISKEGNACSNDANDDCIRNEIKKCRGADFNFSEFNCCMCVSNALYACGLEKEGAWPNSPHDASNPPYTPRGRTDPLLF